MLAALKQFFSTEPDTPVDQALVLRKTAALLMLEVAKADQNYSLDEQEVMIENIASAYELTVSECQQLLQRAEVELEEVVSLQSLTRLLVEQCSVDERQQLLVQLWKVAYADGDLDKYEEHIIRRIADLLYISHSGFIQAKLAAQSEI